MSRKIDLTGKRFGNVVVVREDKSGASHDTEKRLRWICRCDCGKEWSVRGSNLKAGNTKSCGCLSKSQHLTHGLYGSPEYYTWKSMIQRCTNPETQNFHRYGGRGITVCAQWKDFACFHGDMGKRPSRNHTLERIDNNGNYEPSNCRWASRKEQARNTMNSIFVIYCGQKMSLADAIDKSGMNAETVYARRKRGWSDNYLFLPPGSRNPDFRNTK